MSTERSEGVNKEQWVKKVEQLGFTVVKTSCATPVPTFNRLEESFLKGNSSCGRCPS